MAQFVSLFIAVLATLSVEDARAHAMPPFDAPAVAEVTTVAGSGAPGYRDGPRLQAQFMFPAALAMDRTGKIYIADAAAQRIRVIALDGMVRTLAGSGTAIDHGLWVPAGYRDGPGAQAQFSSPMGIAVGPDGMIYVADTYNSRIRRVAPDGTVSTFAVLGLPSALAFDRGGDLYVADRQLGLRRVSPAGIVSALPMNVVSPFGVAVYDGPSGLPSVVASDPQGLVLSSGGYASARLSAVSDAGRSNGTPFQVAMLDGETMVYTDARTHTVRYLHDNTTVLLGGSPAEDPYDGGGFRDGPSPTALFDAPLGIIATPDGSFLVADSGNRRIRRIAGFDRREVIDRWQPPERATSSPPPAAPSPASTVPPLAQRSITLFKVAQLLGVSGLNIQTGEHSHPPARARYAAVSDGIPRPVTQTAEAPGPSRLPAPAPGAASTVLLPPARENSRDFRILYLGNSTIWWNTIWSESIPGIAERSVDRALSPHARRVRLVAVRLPGASVVAMASYLEQLADVGLFDAVVLHLNDGAAGEGPQERWAPPTIDSLRRSSMALRSSHLPFLVVVSPIPLELGPTENIWAKLLGNALTPQYLDRETEWRTVLASVDAPSLDLWPAFFDELRSPEHRPLFSTDDAHLTVHGRELIGNAIATKLLLLHPWTSAQSR